MRLQSASPLTNHFKATHGSGSLGYQGSRLGSSSMTDKPFFNDWPASASVGSLQLTTESRLEINDPVYGLQIVTEVPYFLPPVNRNKGILTFNSFLHTQPALIELIQSPAIQRLKMILQHGITAVVGLCKSILTLLAWQRTAVLTFALYVRFPRY